MTELAICLGIVGRGANARGRKIRGRRVWARWAACWRARARVLYRGMAGLVCSSSNVLNKLTPAMPCGMYGALAAAVCGVMGMTVGGGSGVSTLGGATSLECNMGVTPGDRTWLGLTRCERRGEVDGEPTGLCTGCDGIGVGLVGRCRTVVPIVVGCSDGGAVGGAGRVGSAAEEISESWRSACSCDVPI
jgi:hypothetical protein